MTVARATRQVSGHIYELEVDYRDVGTSEFTPIFLAGTWRITQDGEEISGAEAERIRQEIFETQQEEVSTSTVQRLFGTCRHCGRGYEGRQGYPVRITCECGETDELHVRAITSDAGAEETEWIRRDIFGVPSWQHLQ